MACGIGLCYGCTVNTKQGLRQVCEDGPVFEMGDILWDELADLSDDIASPSLYNGRMKSTNLSNRVIVIGGGAAGLLAAGRAAEMGASVTLIERMDEPGKKLLITGKGRCNITNIAPLKEFLTAFGP